ncbi:MAG: hypothetical protein K2W82_11085 [Candidatus Obscuribacterales bacterium]|nr:hypothetical protein [Candidatus Obscuribacterales bacterium]
MDVYSWMIFLYVAGTMVIGWFLLSELLPSFKGKDKFVGPTYWGMYDGAKEELATEKIILLHEIENPVEERGRIVKPTC